MSRAQYNQLVRMDQIEIEPCALIQHVWIEALRPKQADLGNQLLTLRGQDGQFRFKFRHLSLDHGTANHAKFAAHGMEAKIAERRNSDCGRDQPAEKGLFSLTGSCSGHSLDLNADTLASWFSQYAVLGLIES